MGICVECCSLVLRLKRSERPLNKIATATTTCAVTSFTGDLHDHSIMDIARIASTMFFGSLDFAELRFDYFVEGNG